MRKHVYLFELDSVRKTDEEITAGQRTLYNEIAVKGNIVVMTCNQLVDSRGFFSLLSDSRYQQQLISLFENGALRISQFGEIRTLAQYLINAISPEKKFIFSALPVKFSQKRLLALIRRSLAYSDLSEIHEYCTGLRSEKELKDLFIEVQEPGNGNKEQKKEETQEGKSVEEMKQILKNLSGLLSTVLQLSTLHDIYIHPRNTEEYKHLKLHHLLRIVTGFPDMPVENWKGATDIIRSLSCFHSHGDNRSVYVREIKDAASEASEIEKKSTGRDLDLTVFRCAEVIVNLCYNYTCEISVCNTSKHYNAAELETPNSDTPTFRADFIERFRQEWNSGKDKEVRYLADETDRFIPFEALEQLPPFSRAARITGYLSYKDTDSPNGEDIPGYENDMNSQVRSQKRGIAGAVGAKLGFALLCFLIACLIELGFDAVQNLAEPFLTTLMSGFGKRWHPLLFTAVKVLAFLFISEAITWGISQRFPRFLPLSEALGSAKRLFADIFSCLFQKPETYRTDSGDAADTFEKRNRISTVDYILSPELKKYRDLMRAKKDSPLFAESEIYPIADLNDHETIRQITRLEEMYPYRFGIVYSSSYNTLIVDPVRNGDVIFPYERIFPTSGKDGVVTVPVYRGNFLLLRQYRHAPRSEQYSFPRGFAEPGFTPEEDAKRELEEEIGAVITETPRFLGRVISDSGLTAGRVYVYYVPIDSYRKDCSGYEGIQKIVEIPGGEMEKWIADGGTDDGFTLSAYALYRSREKR